MNLYLLLLLQFGYPDKNKYYVFFSNKRDGWKLGSKIVGPDFLGLNGWILDDRFQIQQIIGGDI